MALGFKKPTGKNLADLGLLGGAGLAALGGPVAPLLMAGMYAFQQDEEEQRKKAEAAAFDRESLIAGEMPAGTDPRTGIDWNQSRPTTEQEQLRQLARVAPEVGLEMRAKQMFPEPEKYGDLKEGFDPETGQPTFFQMGSKGNIRRAQGMTPIQSVDMVNLFDLKTKRPIGAMNKRAADRLITQYPGTYAVMGNDMPGVGGNEAGLNPIFGQDKDGNTIIMQPTKSGTLLQSRLPEGVTPLTPQDLNYQKAMGAKAGTAEAERIAAAPGAIVAAESALRNVRDLKSDPDLSSALGAVQGRLPALYGKQANLVSRIEQVQGRAFLQAFETLKGGGAISEAEGRAATQAIARLNRIQDPNDFIAALDELDGIMSLGLERARTGVRVSNPSAATPATAPARSPAAPALQPAPPLGARTAGQVYQTPRGPMTWTGTGWVPVQQ